jgi:hypothetical protein
MEDIGKHITPLVLNTEARVLKEGLIRKDFSKTGKAYKKMLLANEARTEESATKNSNWAPGALKRSVQAAKKEAKLIKKRKL